MVEIVNLRRERKRQARAEAARAAGENRVRSGRTKAERAADVLEKARVGAVVDGARLEGEEGGV